MENTNEILSKVLSNSKLVVDNLEYDTTNFFQKKQNCDNKEFIKEYLYSFLNEKTFHELNDYINSRCSSVMLTPDEPYGGLLHKHLCVHISSYNVISNDLRYVNPELLTLRVSCTEDINEKHA